MAYALTLDDARISAEVQSPMSGSSYKAKAFGRLFAEFVRGPETKRTYATQFAVGSAGNAAGADLLALARESQRGYAELQWKRLILDTNADASVDALSETVESCLQFITSFGPSAVSFGGLTPNSVHCEHLAAALRATSSWKSEIPSWTEALDVAVRAAKSEGVAPEDLLFGML